MCNPGVARSREQNPLAFSLSRQKTTIRGKEQMTPVQEWPRYILAIECLHSSWVFEAKNHRRLIEDKGATQKGGILLQESSSGEARACVLRREFALVGGALNPSCPTAGVSGKGRILEILSAAAKPPSAVHAKERGPG